MCTRPIYPTCLVLVLVLMAASVWAGLGDPPLVNPSFEDPALDPGAQSSDINGWWDAVGYTYTSDEGGAAYPQTPYGDNWAELGNGRWLYQQIGTYERNMDIDITFLLGQKSGNNHVGLTVELFAGGNAQLAADVDVKRDAAGFPLDSVVGAVLIAASDQLNPFSAAGVAEAVEMSIRLSTGPGGAGYAVGDPLWLVFSRPSANGRTLIDNVVVTAVAKNVATGPRPADQVTDVPRDTVLRWTAGQFGAAHDVYLGTVFEDVSNASRSNLPAGVVFSQGQDANTYDPGRLEFGQTYYWRVDEVNAPPDGMIFGGQVWSFRTEPFAYPILDVRATASSSASEAVGPENTVDGSGLTLAAEGTDVWVHNTDAESMWQSATDGLPATIAFEFDRTYKLHEMRIWNHNTTNESLFGLGAKEVTIEVADSNEGPWTPLADVLLNKAPGLPGAVATDIIPMLGTMASNVRLIIRSSQKGLTTAGLAEVQFLYIPVAARELTPESGTVLDGAEVTLAWRSGREVAEHQVYLATEVDLALVEASDPAALVASMTAQGSYAGFTTSDLNLSETYVWKVVEVNALETPAMHDSPIQSFTTPDYLCVDDFESYTNDSPNRLFQTWIDGLGFSPDEFFPNGNDGNGSGSLVGYDPLAGPIVETTTVHAGRQAMPLAYDNTDATYSETTRTFAGPQDWSRHDIKGLTLWFYGDPANDAQQMYVKINGAKVPYDGDAADLKLKQWVMWYIDLTSRSVSNVTSLSIGLDKIDGVGGAGKVLTDDIRLYAASRQLVVPVDPGTAGLQAEYRFEGNANDSSGQARNGSLQGRPIFAPGRVGQGVTLDGFDDYINIDGYKGVLADAAGVQHAFTVTAWIKTAVNGDIVAWGTNTGGQRMNLRVDTVLRVEHGNGNTRGTLGGSLLDDAWHHVAATVPEAGRMMDVRLYVDGGDVTAPSTTMAAFNVTATVDVAIGMGGAPGGRFFNGSIDEVRIYDRVLSPGEIAWLAGRTTSFDQPF